ncbi:MAG: hypothetical protein J6Z38_03320, partial [Lachnospiraceae bacterium]|nr:hypothetical protein [Lachnospiraceae bacterium]
MGSIAGMLFFLVCLFYFNIPEEFMYTPFIMKLGNKAFYLLFGMTAVLYALVKKAPWKDGLFLSSLALNLFIIVTTVLNKGQTLTALNNYLICGTGTVLLFSLFFEIDVKKFAWTAFAYYFLLVILNNITAIVYLNEPVGYVTWVSRRPRGPLDMAVLCGNYNLTFIYVAIAYVLGVFVCEKYCRWLWPLNLLMLGFSVYTAQKMESDTAMIVFVLMGLTTFLSLLAKRFRAAEWIPKILNDYVLGVLNILAAVAFYMASVGKFTLPGGIDTSMHGRVRIWQFALESFFRKPLLGNGLQVPIEPSLTVSHFNSVYLEMPYRSGII